MLRVAARLADKFATAAVDGAVWMEALVALAEATGSARGQLIGIGAAATVPFNWVNDFSERQLAEFMAIDGGSPRVNPRVAVAVGAPVLSVYSERDYDRAARSLPSDYRDFAAKNEIPFGCQTKLTESSEGIVGLAVLRTEGEGRTRAEDRALFAAVAPHVRSAVHIQKALDHAGAELTRGALQSVGAAVFLCGDDGSVLAMTPGAERMLASGGSLRMTGRKIDAAGTGNGTALRASLARQSATPGALAETLILQQGPGNLPLILDICRAPQGPWQFNFRPRLLVIVRSGQRWHDSAPQMLQKLYHLSPAEADVALRLAAGESRRQIADGRGSTIETVRSQLKSAFSKLGVSREVELTAMLGRIARL